MIEHFIITRFNLHKTDWKRDRSQVEVLDDSWLEERIELFLDFCFPSVVNQSTENFKWLIFFEKASRPKLGRLPEQLKAWPFIEPVFVEGYEEFQEELPKLLQERMEKAAQTIITTRLDNDDALHKDFVKDTRELLAKTDPDTVLHFPYGFCFQQGKRNKLALQHYPLNQFLSLLESVEVARPLLTVYGCEHDKWGEAHTILSGGNKPRWLQVVHERNMANRFGGALVFSNHINEFHTFKTNFSWTYNIRVVLNIIKKKLVRQKS